MTRQRIIPVFVPHLGCPHKCVFCNQNRISGHERSAVPADVVKAVEYAVEKGTADNSQLAFYGGSFTAIPDVQQEALLGTAYEYVRNGIIDSIRLSTRPDAVDDSVIERLQRYGVKTVELGAQSMDSEVLRLSERGHTPEDVESASAKLKDSGFELGLQMMTGLPGDTEEKTVITARKIIECRPDFVRIYPTVIIRDTPMYDMWLKGIYKEHTVEDAVNICSVIYPMFIDAGIPVIRLGLNPTDDLSSGDAAGGAYHPALGELVKSRILRNLEEELVKENNITGNAVFSVCPPLLSQAVGQKKSNITYLKDKYALSDVRFIQDSSVKVLELIK